MRIGSGIGRTEIGAAILVLVGLLLRLREAAQTFLNPDEAQYFYLSLPNSLKQLYPATLSTHHPPLLFFILHPVIAISSSEIALRLFPVLAGSAVGWVAYRWLTRIWNEGAGLAALIILTFSPNLISLSAQARGYSLEMLFAALAILSLVAALDTQSVRGIIVFSAWLYLAILAEYSAAWFAGAAAIYFLLRARESRVSRRMLLVWAAGQAGALCIYATLYRTSIRPLLAESLHLTTHGFLVGGFPQVHSNLLVFAASATVKQFAYAFSSTPLGVLAAVLFGAGLVLLWKGRSRLEQVRGRSLATLLVAPFVLACTGAILGVHPFGKSRHTAILSLFIAAGVGVALERLLRSRAWIAGFTALALMAAWLTSAEPDPNNIAAARHSRQSMIAAIEHLRSSVPPGSLILTERETIEVLGYYLSGQLSSQLYKDRERPREMNVGSFRVVSSRGYGWRDARSFIEDVTEARRDFGLRADEPPWVVDGGWKTDIDAKLTEQDPGLVLPGFRSFDGALTLFQLPGSGAGFMRVGTP